MIIVAVCELYGWDYHTYMAQPFWFIQLILEKMRIDAEKAKKDEIKTRMR